ncbi:MAG: hypothetical protein ACI9XP_001487 [Lentimonas sp.]|jgi:hypothetical protein
MLKKVLLILVLASILAGFLFWRHFYASQSPQPRIEDRLPDGDFLIRANVLDVARESSGMLYFNKIPFRDFFSYEFLLGQGRSFGLNIQEPAYFFANETGDWGALVQVDDYTKISPGIQRLKKMLSLQQGLYQKHETYFWKEENAYLSYGKKWLFIYKGDHFKTYLERVINAKNGDVSVAWDSFLKEKIFENQKLVMMSNWKDMKKYGIEKAILAHDSDSSSFTVLSYFKSSKPWNFGKKPNGKTLAINHLTDKYINIHMDVEAFRKHPEDPLYLFLLRYSNKISFPFADFLEAWEGDLSFRQGGLQTVQERYIETELDENFNVSEISKVREVRVPGFALALSLNDKANYFFSRIKAKGIMTEENEKVRLLLSPALNQKKIDDYYLFYSGEFTPKMKDNTVNNGLWSEKGTKYNFQLDSLSKDEAFGIITFPVKSIIKRNKFF